MEEAVRAIACGQVRIARQTEKENETLAQEVEESETRMRSSGGREEERGTKRGGVGSDDAQQKISRVPSGAESSGASASHGTVGSIAAQRSALPSGSGCAESGGVGPQEMNPTHPSDCASAGSSSRDPKSGVKQLHATTDGRGTMIPTSTPSPHTFPSSSDLQALLGVGQPHAMQGGRIPSMDREASRLDTYPQGEEMDVQDVSQAERIMQEYFTWGIGEVGEMCEKVPEDVYRGTMDMEYYDESTWKRLDPKLVEMGETVEMDRFTKTGFVSMYHAVGRRTT